MSNQHQSVTHLPRPEGALSLPQNMSSTYPDTKNKGIRLTLFDQITDFNNLYAAYKAAARGKHDRASVLRHDLHAEKILWRLQWELKNDHYRHGTYRHFVVVDPKARDVHAAPFTDRIVHHAVVRKIEPLFEKSFIFDSYACRKGKGSHKAALRLQHFLRSALNQNPRLYVLRADIRKYFASIDHATLQTIVARKIHDSEVLGLLRIITDSYHTTEIQNGLGGADLYSSCPYTGLT